MQRMPQFAHCDQYFADGFERKLPRSAFPNPQQITHLLCNVIRFPCKAVD
jgi:hypothetical protein